MSPSEADTSVLDSYHKPPTPPAELVAANQESCQHKDTDDTSRKLYESMSCDEMSKHLAESHRQLSEMLGRQASLSSTSSQSHDSDSLSDSDEVPDQEGETKKQRLEKIFAQAASSGDVTTTTSLLQDPVTRHFIDVDAKDDHGTTPLIYAACFGKLEIAQALLSAGANVDIQDSFGWSALMWATNNNHDSIVKALIDYGASSQAKSAKGRTVFDFVNTDNQKMVDILATNPRDSISSTSSAFMRLCQRDGSMSMSSSSSNAGEYDYYYPSIVEPTDSILDVQDERNSLNYSLDDAASIERDGTIQDNRSYQDEDTSEKDETDDEEPDDTRYDFCWDKCLPHQMFVFADDNLEHILDTVICKVHLPLRSPSDTYVPANVVFLSARFAHYFSNDELLDKVLGGALDRISQAIKGNQHTPNANRTLAEQQPNHRNLHNLSFWMTNCTQLLDYLRRDTAIVVVTADSQLRLSELISEIYSTIVGDTERRIARILGPAMLEYDAIPGMENMNFADGWQRFFRRSSTRRPRQSLEGGLAVQMKRNASSPADANSAGKTPFSPDSLTRVLSDTLFVLQSYKVHTNVVVQAVAQFVHYTSCELFNRILTNKKLLCRSKAMQIRMNLSRLEDWARQHNLPSSLSSYLSPITQLLQLLQCVSQLNDLAMFVNTIKTFDQLNALQVKRCVLSYRYEVDEPRLPEEVEKYALQLAEDTLKTRSTQPPLRSQSTATKSTASPMARTQSVRSQRSDSVSSFVGSIMSSVGLAPSASLPTTLSPSNPASSVLDVSSKEDDTSDDKFKETKDSRFMLPFSVPTTTNMIHHDNSRKKQLSVPSIPEDWMEKLDKGISH